MSGFFGGGVRIARCRVASDGELLAGSNVLSVLRSGAGVYVVTFNEGYFSSTPFSIASSNQPCVITEDHGIFSCVAVSDEETNKVRVDCHDLDGIRVDRPFTLHAIQ